MAVVDWLIVETVGLSTCHRIRKRQKYYVIPKPFAIGLNQEELSYKAWNGWFEWLSLTNKQMHNLRILMIGVEGKY